MKRRSAALLVAVFLCCTSLASSSHGYTISLTRNYVEHYASAAVLTLSGGISPPPSESKPYAEALAVDTVYGTGSYASNGRGFADDIIRSNFLVEGDSAWSDAVIRFFGESEYSIPGGFGNLASGNALSHVRYDFMLTPFFGTGSLAEVTFSITEYMNSYDANSGLQLITLKDSGGNSLFSWEGSLGVQGYPVNLNPSEEYSIWIESHGDFNSPFSFVPVEQEFASNVELVISARELGIPLPPSALLLGAGLVCAFVFRKKLLLPHS